MSEPRRILLVGATGLVGRSVMEAAQAHPALRVIALSRREVPPPPSGRMEMVVADPAEWADAITALAPESVICALGTTWRQAGQDEEAFRAVDLHLVERVATAAKDAGVSNFVLVSSAGANMASKTFYLRVKAEAEAALGKLKFKRLDILRPGLLKGKRDGDRRLLERLGILASPLTDHLLRGSRRSLRSIDVRVVALAALQCAREKAAGRFIHDNAGIRRAVLRLEGKA